MQLRPDCKLLCSWSQSLALAQSLTVWGSSRRSLPPCSHLLIGMDSAAVLTLTLPWFRDIAWVQRQDEQHKSTQLSRLTICCRNRAVHACRQAEPGVPATNGAAAAASSASNGAHLPSISLQPVSQGDALLRLQDMRLEMPDGSASLIEGLSLEVRPGLELH